ncbi:MAG: hypothetical protein A3F54_04170 [Candidatus Kerfeldbacteria bacterium RIFCSPHIGHO2_12_FULL_48_17]|uniref:Uncharacterized protein n=1 Tax=Candidatus Kerfeldbacteria bacterium RIFCSPHIGHO2_12_FULL_48_17 TaxID=1798542 RepID=A0A1G2B6T6_9BACT|nr:MAG: hypothetical protein A3F54_04170 [Candidatus Kerfeldbacteria bacterium RIFCSPHIGHO2_12_FULL_48_17]
MFIAFIVFDIFILIGYFSAYFIKVDFFIFRIFWGVYQLPIMIPSFLIESGKDDTMYIAVLTLLIIFLSVVTALHIWFMYKLRKQKNFVSVLATSLALFIVSFLVIPHKTIEYTGFSSEWRVQRVTTRRTETNNPFKNYYYWGGEKLSLGPSYRFQGWSSSDEFIFSDKERAYVYAAGQEKFVNQDASDNNLSANTSQPAQTLDKELRNQAAQQGVLVGDVMVSPDASMIMVSVGASHGSAPQEVFLLKKK